MLVRPAPGVQLRDPVTGHFLPAEGAEVQPTAFWLRRLRAGDVVAVDVAPAPAPVVQDESEQIPDSPQSEQES